MTARDRRAVLLGAAVLAPALLFIWGVRPFVAALRDARERLTVERETLARERAAVSAARQNPAMQHAADSAMRATLPRLFAGRDDVMASAELASYLGDVARAHKVWLQDASTRPATTADGGVRVLHVEIRAESDLQGILSFLQALSRGEKLVRVNRVDLSSQPSRIGEEDAETLALSANISGFAIPAGEAAPGAASTSSSATATSSAAPSSVPAPRGAP